MGRIQRTAKLRCDKIALKYCHVGLYLKRSNFTSEQTGKGPWERLTNGMGSEVGGQVIRQLSLIAQTHVSKNCALCKTFFEAFQILTLRVLNSQVSSKVSNTIAQRRDLKDHLLGMVCSCEWHTTHPFMVSDNTHVIAFNRINRSDKGVLLTDL